MAGKAKIAIIARSFCRSEALRQQAATILRDYELVYAPGNHELSIEEWTALADGCVAAIIGKETVDAKALAAAPTVRAIAKYGVGLDSIDQEALDANNVALLHRPGVNAAGVAEFTIGLMLGVARRISATSRKLHHGEWQKDGGSQLSGKTVQVVGCGAVGSRVARLVRAFDCKVLLTDILDKSALADEVNGRCVDFAAGLPEADFVTLHVPLTNLTRGMVHADALAQMKPSAYMVNTSRGAVIDETALVAALDTGQIAGAACDVFAQEPLANERLYGRDDMVATPHSAGNAREQVLAMGGAALELLRNFLVDSVK